MIEREHETSVEKTLPAQFVGDQQAKILGLTEQAVLEFNEDFNPRRAKSGHYFGESHELLAVGCRVIDV